MKVLLSFLGKAAKQTNSTSGSLSFGYSTLDYKFDSGGIRNAKYFGLALCDEIKPDLLVVLGTASSNWDVFFDDVGKGQDDDILMLVEAVEKGEVDDEMLITHSANVCSLLGFESGRVQCRVMPVAQTSDDQIGILETIAELIPENSKLTLDVTHGFRHLPMLALVAARYLQHIANIEVTHIYYGAREMTVDNVTPVLDLSGLLSLLDWIETLKAYDKSGDYSLFAPMLMKEGLSENDAANLTQAAFFERVSNISGAKQKLRSIHEALEVSISTPMGKLFWPELKERLSWIHTQSLEDQELKLAMTYLDRGDYLRSSVLMQEALITHSMARSGADANDHVKRKQELDALRKKYGFLTELSELRNSMAHGLRIKSSKNVNHLKSSEDLDRVLRKTLSNIHSIVNSTAR